MSTVHFLSIKVYLEICLFLPYLERWDLLDISRTLYVEVHKEKFTPKFFYYLLLKFENFSTKYTEGYTRNFDTLFSVSFEHFGCMNFFRPS